MNPLGRLRHGNLAFTLENIARLRSALESTRFMGRFMARVPCSVLAGHAGVGRGVMRRALVDRGAGCPILRCRRNGQVANGGCGRVTGPRAGRHGCRRDRGPRGDLYRSARSPCLGRPVRRTGAALRRGASCGGLVNGPCFVRQVSNRAGDLRMRKSRRSARTRPRRADPRTLRRCLRARCRRSGTVGLSTILQTTIDTQ